jgi:DNA polymerase-3 subunit alpha
MDETRRMGMDVLGPNVNESFVKFTVNSEGNVRFGLGAIKGVGESAIKGLIEEREKNGPFVSVYDFMERVNLNSLNKKSIEAMVLAGAFDLFEGIKRSQFFAENQKAESFIESLIKYGNRIKNESGTAQQSLFGETEGFEIVRPALPETPDWPKLEKLNKEKEVIGIFLSAHPLDDYKLEIESFCNVNLADLSNLEALLNKEIVIAGMVTEARSGTTKTGKPFGSLTVQDYTDSFRFMMFDKDYVEYSKYFTPGFFIMIKAKVQKRRHREEEIEVKVSSINLLTSVREEMIKSLSIIIPVDAINDELIDKLMSHARESKGNTELKFIVFDPADKVSLQLFSRSVTIDVSNGFIKYIKSIPGIDYKVN